MSAPQNAPQNPWVQTVSGRAVDLVNPTPDMIDLERDIPEALARIARFNGHIASGPYSVAQHCVIGAHAVLAQTGSTTAALCFLLHDAHEAYIGDIPMPVGAALDNIYASSREKIGQNECHPKTAITILKNRLDAVIYKAGGINFPLPLLIQDTVKHFDIAMLMTERRDLMSRPPHAWDARLERVPPLPTRLTVWPWPRAADEYRAALRNYLPPEAGLSTPRPAPATPLKRPRAKTEGLRV